jgi:hypothetical protein
MLVRTGPRVGRPAADASYVLRRVRLRRQPVSADSVLNVPSRRGVLRRFVGGPERPVIRSSHKSVGMYRRIVNAKVGYARKLEDVGEPPPAELAYVSVEQ